ncbi:MAG: hypothetical protein IKR12_01190 [Clostridia bacterium]|nr:hypothetical protein [Clostridia bacterium]
MKKSKQKNMLDVLLIGLAVLFGALTLIMMATPGLIIKFGLTAEWTVYELLNYGDTTRLGILLALIFAICFVVCAVLLILLKLLGKNLKAEGLVAVCAAGLEIAAAVLFFLAKPLVGEGNNAYASLGIGAILAGVFAILGACALVASTVKKLVK